MKTKTIKLITPAILLCIFTLAGCKTVRETSSATSASGTSSALAILLCILTLTGCMTVRELSRATSASGTPSSAGVQQKGADANQIIQQINQNSLKAQSLVADVNIHIKAPGKSLNVPGKLKIKDNQVIILSVQVPFIGSEAFRIALTPQRVIVVDKINRIYMDEDYSHVESLRKNNIDFYTLQSLFKNKLFVPGKHYGDVLPVGVLKPNAAGHVTYESHEMNYDWTITPTTNQISRATITYQQGTSRSTVIWDYDEFRRLENIQFPYYQSLTLQTNQAKKYSNTQVTFKITDIDLNDNWDTQTHISDKYRRVTQQEILAIIEKL